MSDNLYFLEVKVPPTPQNPAGQDPKQAGSFSRPDIVPEEPKAPQPATRINPPREETPPEMPEELQELGEEEDEEGEEEGENEGEEVPQEEQPQEEQPEKFQAGGGPSIRRPKLPKEKAKPKPKPQAKQVGKAAENKIENQLEKEALKQGAKLAAKGAATAAAEGGTAAATGGGLAAGGWVVVVILIIIAVIIMVAILINGANSKNVKIAANKASNAQTIQQAAANTGSKDANGNPVPPIDGAVTLNDILKQKAGDKFDQVKQALTNKLLGYGLTQDQVNSLFNTKGADFNTLLAQINQFLISNGKKPLYDATVIKELQAAIAGITGVSPPAENPTNTPTATATQTPEFVPGGVYEAIQALAYKGKIIDLTPADQQLIDNCYVDNCDLDYRLLMIMNWLATRHDYLKISFKDGFTDADNTAEVSAYVKELQNEGKSASDIQNYISNNTLQDSPHFGGMAMDISAIDYMDKNCKVVGFSSMAGIQASGGDPTPVMCAWQIRAASDLSAYNTARSQAQQNVELATGNQNLDWNIVNNPMGGVKLDAKLAQGKLESSLGLPPDSFNISQLTFSTKVGERGIENDLNLPTGSFSSSSLWDSAQYLGEAFGLSKALGIPLRRIHGKDLEGIVTSAGLAVMETELGLPENSLAGLENVDLASLSSGNMSEFWNSSFWGVIRNIGQRYLEDAVSFPPHSFDGNTLQDVLLSMTLRQMEGAFGYANNLLGTGNLTNMRNAIAELAADNVDAYLQKPGSQRLHDELLLNYTAQAAAIDQANQTAVAAGSAQTPALGSFDDWVATHPSTTDNYKDRISSMQEEEATHKWQPGYAKAIKNNILTLLDNPNLNASEKAYAASVCAILILLQNESKSSSTNLDDAFGMPRGTIAQFLDTVAYETYDYSQKQLSDADYTKFLSDLGVNFFAHFAAAKLATAVGEFTANAVGTTVAGQLPTELQINQDYQKALQQKAACERLLQNNTTGDDVGSLSFASYNGATPADAKKATCPDVPGSEQDYKNQHNLISQESAAAESSQATKDFIQKTLGEPDFYIYIKTLFDFKNGTKTQAEFLKYKGDFVKNQGLQVMADKLSFSVKTNDYEPDPSGSQQTIPALDPATGAPTGGQTTMASLINKSPEITIRIYPSDILTMLDGNGEIDQQKQADARLNVFARIATRPFEGRLGLPVGTIDAILSGGKEISPQIKTYIATILNQQYKIPTQMTFLLFAWIQGKGDLWSMAMTYGLQKIEDYLVAQGDMQPGTLTQYSPTIIAIAKQMYESKNVSVESQKALMQQIATLFLQIGETAIKPAVAKVIVEALKGLNVTTQSDVDKMYADYKSAHYQIIQANGLTLQQQQFPLLDESAWMQQSDISPPISDARLQQAANLIADDVLGMITFGLPEKIAGTDVDPKLAEKNFQVKTADIGAVVMSYIFSWDPIIVHGIVAIATADTMEQRVAAFTALSAQIGCTFMQQQLDQWGQAQTLNANNNTTLSGLGTMARAILCDPSGQANWGDIALRFGVPKIIQTFNLDIGASNAWISALEGKGSWLDAAVQEAVYQALKRVPGLIANEIAGTIIDNTLSALQDPVTNALATNGSQGLDSIITEKTNEAPTDLMQQSSNATSLAYEKSMQGSAQTFEAAHNGLSITTDPTALQQAQNVAKDAAFKTASTSGASQLFSQAGTAFVIKSIFVIKDVIEGKPPDLVGLGTIIGCAAFSYIATSAGLLAASWAPVAIPLVGALVPHTSYDLCVLAVNVGRMVYDWVAPQIQAYFNTQHQNQINACYKAAAIDRIKTVTDELIFQMNTATGVYAEPTDLNGDPLLFSLAAIITSNNIPDQDDATYGRQTSNGKTTGTWGHFRSDAIQNYIHIEVGGYDSDTQTEGNPLYRAGFAYQLSP